MSASAKILPYYTIADWQQWEGKWELIEGMPHAMSPAPIPKHQRVSFNITSKLNAALKKSCKKCKVYQAIDWQVAEDTIVEPDVLIVCGNPGKRLNFPPVLIIEILSPSTALKDRNSKFIIYQSQQVKYYLLIDIDTNTIELYIHNGQQYQLTPASTTFEFQLADDCEIEVDLSDVWE